MNASSTASLPTADETALQFGAADHSQLSWPRAGAAILLLSAILWMMILRVAMQIF